MSQSSSDVSRSASHMELIQNLFEEIIQIQKESKASDEAITRIKEIVLESSKAVENSTCPSEMIMDAKILETGSNYVSTNVTSLNTNLTVFNESKYVNGVLSYLQNTNQVFPQGKEWSILSPITYKMFKKSHPLSFMHGTISLEPSAGKAKAERKHANKKGAEAEKKVLTVEKAEQEEQQEEGSDVYDHIFKWLVKHYKKNDRRPISFFNFIIDPESYWRTVQNIFHFSFLVRDGNVKIQVLNGLPVVEPVFEKAEERTVEPSNSSQFCFSLNMKDWETSIGRFQIRSSSIPPFVKDKEKEKQKQKKKQKKT